MKLGKQTANLVSHLVCKSKQPLPVTGQGATVCHWSDRHACTVLWVDPVKCIVCLQRDRAEVLDRDRNLGWRYSPDPGGTQYRFKFKDGTWRELEYQSWTKKPGWRLCRKGCGAGLILGVRDEHYDPAF
jgi:hypothetical protein